MDGVANIVVAVVVAIAVDGVGVSVLNQMLFGLGSHC